MDLASDAGTRRRRNVTTRAKTGESANDGAMSTAELAVRALLKTLLKTNPTGNPTEIPFIESYCRCWISCVTSSTRTSVWTSWRVASSRTSRYWVVSLQDATCPSLGQHSLRRSLADGETRAGVQPGQLA